MSERIKVLIVDDSALVRKRLAEELANDPALEVVGQAPDPYVARDKIIKLKPDVLTLDMQMPRMDGLTFLRKLADYYPLPVVVVSAYTPEGGQLTLQALEQGAVEVMAKPALEGGADFAAFGAELCDKVKAAAKVKMSQARKAVPARAAEVRPLPALRGACERVIAIGASTGGTEALSLILRQMPENAPPILIVQHMPRGFTRAFAERLNALSAVEVLEAEDGLEVRGGRAIIARGDHHLLLQRSGRRSTAQVKEGPPVCRHCPSVEVLFDSTARAAGADAVGILLTGMGRDGAEGLLRMRQAGARTIAQDEASSVVFGMPKEAIALGAAERVVSLDRIAAAALSLAQQP